jgi:NAD+ synthase
MNNELNIDPSIEKTRITGFIKSVLKKKGFKKVIIGMSGGIDSTASFYLLKEVVAPENIFVAHLYYLDSQFQDIDPILKEANIPKKNIYELCIDPLVATSEVVLRLRHTSEVNRVRLGNIMARIRMIILYDLAKKHNALVCGTENRSEYLLGYFTRFGDQASDFEPIQHLYKTQIFQLATFLNVPKNIINKTPTAGLWPGQTDEKEYGFTYKEADQVLFYYNDKKLNIEEIKRMGFANADKIIDFSLRNNYKHNTPYILDYTDNHPNTKHH